MCTVTTTTTTTVTPEPGAPRVRILTRRELDEAYLRYNASKPNPNPICDECRMPYDREDCDPFDPHTCTTCGINRLEQAVRRLFKSRGKKARKKALRRLFALKK